MYKVTTSGTGTPLAWYPAPGYRDFGRAGYEGALYRVGHYGYSWSSTSYGSDDHYRGMGLDFRATYLGPSYANYRAYGFQLRCLSEESRTAIHTIYKTRHVIEREAYSLGSYRKHSRL